MMAVCRPFTEPWSRSNLQEVRCRCTRCDTCPHRSRRQGFVIGKLHQLQDNETPIVSLREASSAPWAEERPDRLGRYQMFAGFAALLWVTVVVGVIVRNQDRVTTSRGWDIRIARWIADHRTTWMTRAAGAVSLAGSAPVLIAGTAGVGVWLWRRTHRSGTAGLPLLALVDTQAVVQIAKRIVARSRPPTSLASSMFDGWAWPSGHAASATAVAASVCVVATAVDLVPSTRRRICCGIGSIAVLIAASRLVLGAHWTSDVLMGGAIGVAVVGLLARSLLSDTSTRSGGPGDVPLVPSRTDARPIG